MKALLARLEDFRLLPVFVVVGMVAGAASWERLARVRLHPDPAHRCAQGHRRRDVEADSPR